MKVKVVVDKFVDKPASKDGKYPARLDAHLVAVEGHTVFVVEAWKGLKKGATIEANLALPDRMFVRREVESEITEVK